VTRKVPSLLHSGRRSRLCFSLAGNLICEIGDFFPVDGSGGYSWWIGVWGVLEPGPHVSQSMLG
jgi:hypothetical protein